MARECDWVDGPQSLRQASPPQRTLNTYGPGKKQGLALADHQVVFAAPEIIPNTVKQTGMHSPFRKVWLNRLA